MINLEADLTLFLPLNTVCIVCFHTYVKCRHTRIEVLDLMTAGKSRFAHTDRWKLILLGVLWRCKRCCKFPFITEKELKQPTHTHRQGGTHITELRSDAFTFQPRLGGKGEN